MTNQPKKFRIDERLIHGQVAIIYTRTYNINRIIVVGSHIVENEVTKSALKMARPDGTKLSILRPATYVRRTNEGIYDSENVFLITDSPVIALEMVEQGLEVDELNVGNMGMRGDRTQVLSKLYMNDEEREACIKLIEKGVNVYAQTTPNTERKDLDKNILSK